MAKISLYIIILLTLISIFSCNRNTPKIGDIITASRRVVLPSSINLSGLKFYQKEEEVKNILGNLKCEKKDSWIDLCTCKRNIKEQDNTFKGIEQFNLTFFNDSLQNMQVQYSQMFDVEYKYFENAVREKYSYAIANRLTDTTGYEWKYDSVKIVLVPNKKQHWTGSIFVYTPTLDFQERTLYKRWLDEIERGKVNKVF